MFECLLAARRRAKCALVSDDVHRCALVSNCTLAGYGQLILESCFVEIVRFLLDFLG